MRNCNHTEWLDFSIQEIEIVFQETDWFKILTNHLSNSDTCYFSLLTLIGTKTKWSILQKLISAERKYKLRNKNEIHLHFNVSITFHEKSVFYADSSLFIHLARDVLFQKKKYHESINWSLFQIWENISNLTKIETSDYFFFHLLWFFTDVFCLFFMNMSDLECVAECLVSWLERDQTSAVSKRLNSDLMLIMKSETCRTRIEKVIKWQIL